MYPEKQFNTHFVAVITDPNAPWYEESSCILTSFDEYTERCYEFATKHRCNIIGVYNASLGILLDPTIPLNRNYFNDELPRPEYAMHAVAMTLGLQFNRTIGLNSFMVNSHSNGDDCSIVGTNYMDIKEDAYYITICSLGPVGDLKKASRFFKNYRGIMEVGDSVARIGRGFLDDSYLEYIDTAGTYWPSNHYIDKEPYCSLHHEFYEKSYSSWRDNK